MKRGLIGSLLAAACVLLLLLQACNEDNNSGDTPSVTAKTNSSGNGGVILDGLAEDGKLPEQAEPELTEQEQQEQARLTPPYLTISGKELLPREEIKIVAGNRMWAYYELAEAPPEGAFLVMVPENLEALDAPGNLEAALELHYLGDERFAEESGTFLGNPVFQMLTLGDFVFRIFMGEAEEEQMFLESEGFTIIEATKPAE